MPIQTKHLSRLLGLVGLALLSFACGSSGSLGGGFFVTQAGAACTMEETVTCGAAGVASAALVCTNGKWEVALVCESGTVCVQTLTGPACRKATQDTTDTVDVITPDIDDTGDATDETDTDFGDFLDVADSDVSATDEVADATDLDVIDAIDAPDVVVADADADIDTDMGAPVDCVGGCPDGKVCSSKGVCVKQICADATFGPDVQKFSTLEISAGTEGCDVNGDGTLDNAMGKALSSLNFLFKANSALGEQIALGKLVLLFETDAYQADGTEFPLNLLQGDADVAAGSCDYTKASCKYTVRPDSYDLAAQTLGPCPAKVLFPDAKIMTQTLKAAAKGKRFSLPLLTSGLPLGMTVVDPAFEGDVWAAFEWTYSQNGKLCGVLAYEDLLKGIDAAPDSVIQALGVGDKAALKSLMKSMFKADIDLNGDGTKDGISVAFRWSSVQATLTGFTAP